MRHSPAEYFIKYLCSRPGTTVNDVRSVIGSLSLGLMPEGSYVQDIFDEIQANLPANYNPRDLTHKPSQSFLKRLKISGMWRSTYPVLEAVELFKNRPAREMVESLLLTQMRDEEIAEVLAHSKGLNVIGSSIEAFRHYFWNTDLLSLDDWSSYLMEPSMQPIKLTALRSPKNMDGMRLTLYKLGVMPRSLEKETIFTSLRDVGYMNFLEGNGFPQGRHKAEMLRSYASIVKEAQDKIDEIHAGEEDVIEEFYKKTIIDSRVNEHKTLAELTGESDGEGSVRELPSGS